MSLKFLFQYVYGRPKFYPLDHVSKTFCEMMDKKCLSAHEMKEILKLMLHEVSVEVSRDGDVMTTSEIVSLISK
jgi:hypothetical protein